MPRRRVWSSQTEAYRERIASAVSGLLALLGIDADPISSREHILLSNVLDHAWRAGHDLDMAGLIHAVQSPPFQKVGVIDLETFFPAKDRFALAMKLNNLLASPGFAGWMEGEPLDVGGLLYTRDGKAAAVDRVDRAPLRQRADVLRHDPLERGAGLGPDPAGHIEPARRPLHGRDLRLLPPDRQPAVEGADADVAQAGASLRPGGRAGDPEPGRSRLQGALERRDVVPGPLADPARQGSGARGAGGGLDSRRARLRPPGRWTRSSRVWAAASS